MTYPPSPQTLAATEAENSEARLTADEKRALRERAVNWVEKSCAEQGVPVKLSDPLALAKIADILCEARDKQRPS
jgi:hypothetical protein